MLEIKRLSDEEYHSIKGFDTENRENSVISASLLKRVLKEGVLGAVHNKVEHDNKTMENFKIGTLIHMYLLEKEKFAKTHYIGEYDPLESRKRVDKDIGDMLISIEKDITTKYPFFDGGENEIAFVGECFDLSVKAKMDKIIETDLGLEIYDLKSTNIPLKEASERQIKKIVMEYMYNIQLAFYGMLVEEYYRQKNWFVGCEHYIVFVSKADYACRLVKLSEETIGYAREEVFRTIEIAKSWINNTVQKDEEAILI